MYTYNKGKNIMYDKNSLKKKSDKTVNGIALFVILIVSICSVLGCVFSALNYFNNNDIKVANADEVSVVYTSNYYYAWGGYGLYDYDLATYFDYMYGSGLLGDAELLFDDDYSTDNIYYGEFTYNFNFSVSCLSYNPNSVSVYNIGFDFVNLAYGDDYNSVFYGRSTNINNPITTVNIDSGLLSGNLFNFGVDNVTLSYGDNWFICSADYDNFEPMCFFNVGFESDFNCNIYKCVARYFQPCGRDNPRNILFNMFNYTFYDDNDNIMVINMYGCEGGSVDYFSTFSQTYYSSNALSGSYNSGYDSGFNYGRTNGYTDGYNQGKIDGISQGFNDGYNSGYYEGLSQENDYTFLGLLSAVVDAPIRALIGGTSSDGVTTIGLLNFEILGFNFAYFFVGLLTLGFIIFIIRHLL